MNGKSIIAFPSAARALAALDKLSTEIDEAPSLQAIEAIANAARELVTLKDAGTYITKLSKAEHQAPEWQAAMPGLDPGRDCRAARRCSRGSGCCKSLSRHQQQRKKPAAEGDQKA